MPKKNEEQIYTQILYDIPNHEYQQMGGLSSSELRNLHFKSPFHYKYYLDNPEQDEYKKFYEQGTLIHTGILEPSKINENICVLPQHILDFRTKESKELRDAALAEHKNVLLYKDHLETINMIDTYRKNPLVKTYVDGGVAESSMFWVDKDTNILCKCRPDYINIEQGYILDVKSTGDLDKFRSSVYKYNYHVQAGHYIRGASAATGKKIETFLILALSKEPPYDVELFVFSEDALNAGVDVCKCGLSVLRDCLDSGEYPNKYGQELQVIEWRTNT